MARYPGQPKESDTADVLSGELPCEWETGKRFGFFCRQSLSVKTFCFQCWGWSRIIVVQSECMYVAWMV